MNHLRIATLVSLTFLVGCSRSESAATTQTQTITPAVLDAYKTRCAPCHGETGHADGPAIAKLPVKPPNFADVAWQKSFTDAYLRRAIVEGGPAVGKSPAMPSSRDLVDGKPELLDGLLALVRSFDGK